jgi:hypothetical protein
LPLNPAPTNGSSSWFYPSWYDDLSDPLSPVLFGLPTSLEIEKLLTEDRLMATWPPLIYRRPVTDCPVGLLNASYEVILPSWSGYTLAEHEALNGVLPKIILISG